MPDCRRASQQMSRQVSGGGIGNCRRLHCRACILGEISRFDDQAAGDRNLGAAGDCGPGDADQADAGPWAAPAPPQWTAAGDLHHYYEVEPFGIFLIESVINSNIPLYYKSGEEIVRIR